MNTSFEWAEVPGWLQVVVIAAAAVQITVEIYALVVLFRTPEERITGGKRWLWAVIILFVNLIGAIVFFVAGRKPLPAVDPLATANLPSAPPETVERAQRAADVLYGPRDGDEA